MDVSAAAVPKPAHRYRLPALLQDIRLLDLLDSWEPLDESLPDVEDLPVQTRADL